MDKLCAEKHTKHQPKIEDFNCPSCGAKAGDFCVDDSPNFECDKLHPGDYLICFKCQESISGKAFASSEVKRLSLVTCEACKGTGLVTKT